MRVKLREMRGEMSIRDSLRAIRGNIETIFWMLKNMNTSQGTGGDTTTTTAIFSVDTVETLPPIPDTGYQKVFWTSMSGGTGDNQNWDTNAGQTRWYPCQRPTTLDGTPGV